MLRSRAVLACVLLSLLAGRAAAAPPPVPPVRSEQLASAARAIHVGQRLDVTAVEVPSTSELLTFELERFAVFARDAEVLVHGDGGARRARLPSTAYFRGGVRGEPGSRVFLAVLPSGRVQGIVARAGDDHFLIDSAEDGVAATGRSAALRAERAASGLLSSENEPWTCDAGSLTPPRSPLEGLDLVAQTAPAVGEGAGVTPGTAALVAHTVRLAIETDHELFQIFGNAAAATNYIGNLVGYASTIYEREISTSLLVQSVSLWSTSADPWSQTNTTCGLMEFGRYWNKYRTGVSRSIAHFLSGKGLGGGIAWLGVLCRGAFSASASCPGVPTDAPWGGGYGFTASISGGFDIDDPRIMWDIMAVTHEIGHNFNSPHSHCYNGIGGSSSPVDQCRSGEGGCYSGVQSLPGPAGVGSGTLMSYCHLLRGSYSDVSLSFGAGHPYGVQPGRVPNRMLSHVNAVASTNPACLAPAAGQGIFGDGFEAGAETAWSSATP